MKLNGTHQFLAYADDVNLLGDDIDTIKRNKEALINASKEVGLAVNVEKTLYIFISRDQNAGRNWDIKIGKLLLKIMSQFRYLRTTVTNQNSIQQEIKRSLKSSNACYHLVQNILSYRLLSKNIKLQDYNFARGVIWV
jgi:hypothetical protein